MRAREFIVEYNRNLTMQKLGDSMLNALYEMQSSKLPDIFVGPRALVYMAINPESYPDKTIRMAIHDHWASFGPSTAKEVLAKERNNILNIIMDYFQSADPTQNKEYTLWLIKSWINNPRDIDWSEDINRNNLLSIHQRGRQAKKILPPDSDINRFSSYSEFEDMMYNKYGELVNSPSVQNRGTAKEIFNSENVRVIMPEDEAAACYYGQGTKWCTATTRGHNFFDSYNQDGPLYILIPKKPKHTGEKYQIWFGGNTDDYVNPDDYQFMDERDKSVDPIFLFRERFPELEHFDIFKYYLGDTIPFVDPTIIKQLTKIIVDAALTAANKIGPKFENDRDDEYQAFQEYLGHLENISYTDIIGYLKELVVGSGLPFVPKLDDIIANYMAAYNEDNEPTFIIDDYISNKLLVVPTGDLDGNEKVLGSAGDYSVIETSPVMSQMR